MSRANHILLYYNCKFFVLHYGYLKPKEDLETFNDVIWFWWRSVLLKTARIWSLNIKKLMFYFQAKNLGIKIENNNKAFVVYSTRIFMMQLTMYAICGTMLSQHFESYWLILKFCVSYVMMDGCYTTTFCVYNYFIFSFGTRFVIINDSLR